MNDSISVQTKMVCNTAIVVHNAYDLLMINMIGCVNFDIIHQNFDTAYNLKDLVLNIYPKRIISFIHAIGVTNKL